MASVQNSIGTLHDRWRQGDRNAGNFLYSLAFARLRAIAASLLHRDARVRTLQPTALIHEFFLKFHHSELRILNDDHFYRISARAMRQVLVDYSRRRNAQKRIAPDEIPSLLQEPAEFDPAIALEVRSAFDRLRRYDPVVARVVWERAVEGATIPEVSMALGLESWRVRESFDFGIEWLAEQLGGGRRR